MEAANHLMLVNCFTIEMLNDRQLYSVKRERERLNVHVLIICICLSVPTNNETA